MGVRPGSVLGSAVRRREDPRLVTGRGCYVDDVRLDGGLHAVFARSPVAHARIAGIDVTAAAAMPGVAQALYEEVVYDADGSPRTASLLDYAFPTANELPRFETDRTVTPTHLNALGVKGIGESGTIGSGPAVHNAVIDALSHLGIRHLDMPLTPEKVWRAIDQATHSH